MKRRYWALLALCATGIIGLVCFLTISSGLFGPVIDYGGADSVAVKDGIQVGFWVDCHTKRRGIPYWYTVSIASPPPYDLEVTFFDPKARSYEVTIIRLEIVYAGGTTIKLVNADHNWRKRFTRRIQYNSSSRGLTETIHAIVTHKFEGAIAEQSQFNVQVDAIVKLSDGSEVPINTRMLMTPRPAED